MPTATMNQPQAGTPASKAAPVIVNPFIRAAKEHVEPFDDRNIQMTTAAVQQSPIDIAPYGWLRGLWVIVTATGGVGATTTAINEDAPWNVLQGVTITDTNGTPVFGPVDGYDVYLINKYTMAPNQDPTGDPKYSAPVVGASASGNFAFLVYVPLEASPVDGYCSLANASSASTYKFSYTLAPSTVVYSTPPSTTLPVVNVKSAADCYASPGPTDANGVQNQQAPPGFGSTMFTSRQQYNTATGQFRVRLTKVGNLIRTLILIYRVSSSRATGETNLPTSFRLDVNKQTMHNVYLDILRSLLRRQSELGKDNGVFVFDFTHDAGSKIGQEMRNKYLATTLATALELDGSWGSAGVLTVITQDVAPKGSPYPLENY